jgi:hypothetical protein
LTALVVTRDGIPLGYEVFDGNRVHVTTVEEVVSTMESRFGLAERIWVMDRGMTSRSNVAWLQETNRRYLLGTSRNERRRWSRELSDEQGWLKVREGVEAKLIRQGGESFVLCRSAERRRKESAMHGRFSLRIEEGLQSLHRRRRKARHALDRGPLERQIGRLLQKDSRAAGRFIVKLVEGASLPAKRTRPRPPSLIASACGCLSGSASPRQRSQGSANFTTLGDLNY